MKVIYNKNIDTMYIHFTSDIPNILTQTNEQNISKFISKADKSRVVGFEIEEASLNIKKVLKLYQFSLRESLAILLVYDRSIANKTQKEMSEELGISETTYKNIEKAEQNITIDTIERIKLFDIQIKKSTPPEERSIGMVDLFLTA